MKLNKSQFIEMLAAKLEVNKKEAKKFLDSFQECIAEGLKSKPKTGQKIAISGFANFEVKKRKARKMRNPQTGEMIKVPAKKVLKITPLKAFKEATL
jgi:DNA-binding protein HU-beta